MVQLPFFGGYPDAFWTGYADGASAAEYTFASAPSLAVASDDGSVESENEGRLHATSGWQVSLSFPL